MGNLLYKDFFRKKDHKKPLKNNFCKQDIFSLTREAVEGKNILVVGKKGKGKSTLIIDIISKLPFKCGHVIHSDEELSPIYKEKISSDKIHKKFTTEVMASLLYDHIRFNTDFKYFVIDTDKRNKSKNFKDTLSKLMKDQHYTILMAVEEMSQQLRDKFDLIFIFKDSNAAYMQQIWEDWQGSQEAFRDKIKHLENDHTCLVINRTSHEMFLWPSLGNSWTICNGEHELEYNW